MFFPSILLALAFALVEATPKLTLPHHHHFLTPGLNNFLARECSYVTNNETIWKYTLPHLDPAKGVIEFENLKNKVILIVNVATFCDSTHEYLEYNKLVDKYGDKLAIIGVPCNQFLNQEPTADHVELVNALKYVRPGNGFEPKFPLSQRSNVNGNNELPLYSFLKRSCPAPRMDFAKDLHLIYEGKSERDIRWNFEKFLVHPTKGQVYKRYDQKFKPEDLPADIDFLLKFLEQ